jgi:hypothetical protein
MAATLTEFTAPHGSLGVLDRVRLAAFGLVLSTMAVSSGGGGGTSSPRPAPGERPDAPERPDPAR